VTKRLGETRRDETKLEPKESVCEREIETRGERKGGVEKGNETKRERKRDR